MALIRHQDQRLFVSADRDKAVAEPLTLDHVRLFIGLKTNVHRTPPGKWKKQMIDAAEIEAHKAIEKQLDEIHDEQAKALTA